MDFELPLKLNSTRISIYLRRYMNLVRIIKEQKPLANVLIIVTIHYNYNYWQQHYNNLLNLARFQLKHTRKIRTINLTQSPAPPNVTANGFEVLALCSFALCYLYDMPINTHYSLPKLYTITAFTLAQIKRLPALAFTYCELAR